MVWGGRDLKDHVVQPPCPGQGCHPLDQVAQSSVQHDFEMSVSTRDILTQEHPEAGTQQRSGHTEITALQGF